MMFKSTWKSVIFYCLFFITIHLGHTRQLSYQQERKAEQLIQQILNFNQTLTALNTSTRFVFECRTIHDKEGVCIEIKKCSLFMDYIVHNRTDKFDDIRNSKCSPHLRVCCPKISSPTKKPHNKEVVTKSIFPAECGTQSKAIVPNRIFGGREANLFEFPWMARLVHSTSGRDTPGCGGFLIHSRFVLTAAHCLKSSTINIMGKVAKVVLGELDTKSNPDCTSDGTMCAPYIDTVGAKDPIIHPKYQADSRDQLHDIAIIPLAREVRFTDSVQPICIPTNEPNAQSYTLAGWGRTSYSDSVTTLLTVDVPYYDFEECKKLFKSLNVDIKSSQICVGGEEGRDACTGDSGGPLMYYEEGRWYVGGIISFGVGCAEKDWPAIYTKVSSYVDWLEETIGKITTHSKKKER